MSEKTEEEAPAEDAPKKKSKKKLIIIIAAVLLLGGGGAGAFLMMGKKPPADATADGAEAGASAKKGDKDKDKATAEAGGVFHDLPDVLVNLDGTGHQAHFLKMKISLELDKKEDEAAIDKILPRVTDQFQTYLRELRTEDLKGAAGIYRLRQELLTRVSAAAAPIAVRDVLFREMLIQ